MEAVEEKETTDYRIIVTAFWDGIESSFFLNIPIVGILQYSSNLKLKIIPASAILFAICLLMLLIFNLCFKKDARNESAKKEKIDKEELIQGLYLSRIAW